MKNNNSAITTVIGASAKGKTSSIIVPQLLDVIKKGQSFVICDPKNQILNYIGNELERESFKTITLNLREPSKSMSWNPLIPPYRIFVDGNKQKAYSLLSDVAKSIYVSLGGQQKDFWDSSAYAFFVGLVSSIYDKASEEEINLKSILNMAIVGEEKFAASNYLKEYFDLEVEGSYPRQSSHNVINAPTETKGGILAVFKNSLQQLSANNKYENILCFNDFSLEDCMQDKVAIILNYEDENPDGAVIVSVFLDMFYKYVIDKRTKQPELNVYTFFLDDFLSLPKLYSFDEMIMSSISRNVSLVTAINSRSLFEKKYGKESMDALLSNSTNIMYFSSNDINMHQHLSDICKQKGFNWTENENNSVLYISENEKPKLLPLSLSPIYNFVQSYTNTHLNEQVKVFPMKEYVKEKKRNKLFESLESPPKELNILNENHLPTSFINNGQEVRGLVGSINERMQELSNME